MTEDVKNALYSAAGDSKPENLRFEDEGLTLVVPGVISDRLTFVSSAEDSSSNPSELSASDGFNQSHNSGNSDEQDAEGFSRTGSAVVDNLKWLREWAAQQLQETNNVNWKSHIQPNNWNYRPQGPPSQFDEPIYVLTREPLKEAYLQTLIADVYGPPEELKGDDRFFEMYENMLFSLWQRLEGRRFAVSQSGLLALVPTEAREGDNYHCNS